MPLHLRRLPLLLLPAMLATLLAAAPAPAASSDEKLPEGVEQQIDEVTEKLPEEIREKVRKRMADAVREELERVDVKQDESDDAKDDKDDKDDKENDKADKKEKKSDAASTSDSGEKAKSDDADDAKAKEVKKLREEVELQEARFKFSVSKYEKQLEDQRLAIEKAKIDRRLASERAAEEDTEVQREVDRLKLECELQKRKAESAQLRVDAALSKARSDKAVIEQSLQTEDAKERMDERVLGDEAYPDKPFKDGVLTVSLRRIELNGPIFSGAADYVCQRLDFFNNQSSKPIFLIIDDCPGGSAIQGFQIVQAIGRSKAPVHVVIKRMAASMAAIIATLADHSYCYPDALILHHQASAILAGNGRDIEDQVRQFKEISHRLIGAVAKKLGMSEKEFVDEMYKNRISGDWELFGDEAVAKGWIEHVATTVREEGVRSMPKGMRTDPSPFIIIGEKQGEQAMSQGYMERYHVELKEEVDSKGKRYVQLPRLSPLDAYLLYNPDGYYR